MRTCGTDRISYGYRDDRRWCREIEAWRSSVHVSLSRLTITQTLPMSKTSPGPQAPSSSTPNFQPIFEKALDDYKRKTGNDLTTHPLATELNDCDSPQAILNVLEGKANGIKFHSGDERFSKWLVPTVNILGALSATLGQGVHMVSYSY